MLTDCFYAEYHRFSTVSKKEAAALLSADNLVGDRFEIVFKTENHQATAWLKNRFGGEIGYFDSDISRKLRVFAARDWILTGVLSFVAYSDLPEPGSYWGEVALICFDPRYEAPFSKFVTQFGSTLHDRTRSSLSYSEHELQKIVESNGSWLPSASFVLPQLEKGSAYIKTDRSFTEKMVEHGRKGNKGCYLVSWLFIIACLALVVLLLRSCFVA